MRIQCNIISKRQMKSWIKWKKTYDQVINWVLLTKSYWQTHTYRSLQPFNFFINYTVISFKTNLYSKFSLSIFRIIQKRRDMTEYCVRHMQYVVKKKTIR